jgi:hypothetical protein
MSSNRTTEGEFRLNRHGIVVTNRLNGSVTSNVFPDSSFIDCGSGHNTCTSEQDYNTLVTIQAVADEGNFFVNWTGTSPCSAAGRATNASCSFQLKGSRTATGRAAWPSMGPCPRRRPSAGRAARAPASRPSTAAR